MTRAMCVNGHPWNKANVYTSDRGKSGCKICRREKDADYRRAHPKQAERRNNRRKVAREIPAVVWMRCQFCDQRYERATDDRKSPHRCVSFAFVVDACYEERRA